MWWHENPYAVVYHYIHSVKKKYQQIIIQYKGIVYPIGKGERLKLKCRDPGKKWCTKSAFWLGQLHSQQHHQQIRQENRWIVNTDWHYKNKFLPSKRLVGMVGEAAEGFLGRCRMIEHALYLIHFLSLVQLSTGRIQLCGCVWVHGESVGRGRGHCVHWLQRWEGGGLHCGRRLDHWEGRGPRWPYLFCTYFKSVVINVAFFVVYICTTI